MTSLADMNTLAVPSSATRLHVITGAEDLLKRWRDAQAADVRPVILGGGSNVVLAEHIGTPVWLIRNRGLTVEACRQGAEVTVAAGESWHGLVRWSLGLGLPGLENMALIPGSVGAAPVQNIGAYGEELAACFIGAEALNMRTGKIERLGAEELAFGYRTSSLKTTPGAYVILSLTLRLGDGRRPLNASYPDVAEELKRMGRQRRHSAVDIAEAVVRVRRRKLPDPRFVPNAGSFFRNPVIDASAFRALEQRHGPLRHFPDPDGVKLAAAQLIDLCLKAARAPVSWAEPDAPIRVWDRQPLVLTNPGRRPAGEVLAVADLIRQAVAERFGIRLQMEPDEIRG